MEKVKSIFQEYKPEIFNSLKGYNRQRFVNDLMAGLIVGIVALPLALAFGIASGVTPEKGVLTSIIAGFIVSALGGSSVQVAGPTGAFIVIVYNTIQSYGLEGLVVVTIMSGIMLIIMGILKLGVVIKFIPYPIMVGYMSGIAVLIFSTQMKEFFGLQITEAIPPDFLGKWQVYLKYFHTVDPFTIVIGLISILIIVLMPRWTKKIPGSLVAVVVVTLIVFVLREYFQVMSITTIGDHFELKGELPQMADDFSLNIELINSLFPTAFTLAMLGSIESLISASVADGATGKRSNLNMELVAQGVANIFTGFFKGIPATGALARTMTNVNNGGRTPIAGIVHSVFLTVVVLFLGKLTQHIPLTCLAAVLIIVSYNMSEWRSFWEFLNRNSISDIVVLLATFLLTLIFDLTIAIEVSLLLAIFIFLKRVNDVSHVSIIKKELDLTEEGEIVHDDEKLILPDGLEVYEIDGPFFFGMANKFEESMRVIGDKSDVRIIRMRKVPFMDSTGIHNLESLCEKSIKDDIQVILSGVRPNVHEMIEKSGIPQKIGAENICGNITLALERAQILLDEKAKMDERV